MQYFIGFTLPKLIRQAHEEETKKLSKLFGILPLHDRSVPHLTFKAPFEFEDIKSLTGHLKEFCRTQKVGEVKVDGYFFWESGTIAWKAIADDDALFSIKKLLDFLKSMPDLPEDDRANREMNLHASVARFLTPDKSEEIQKYLQSAPKPQYETKLDTISIYHKVNSKWEELSVIPVGQIPFIDGV